MASNEQTESLIRTFDHNISLPAFEGPMDLLLFLIRKNEIDIYDIPIESITRQYLAALRSMESMKLEIAGEFFVMAASLMLIKSRMLLPKDEQIQQSGDDEEEGGSDPRWELVQQLIEYKKFKEVAKELDRISQEASNLLVREWSARDEPSMERPLRPLDSIDLWNVFNKVLRRLSEKITVGEIHDESYTVAECMEQILLRIQKENSFRFTDLFTNQDKINPTFIVASFLALLELTRLDQLKLEQTENFSDILCRKNTEAEALNALNSEDLEALLD